MSHRENLVAIDLEFLDDFFGYVLIAWEIYMKFQKWLQSILEEAFMYKILKSQHPSPICLASAALSVRGTFSGRSAEVSEWPSLHHCCSQDIRDMALQIKISQGTSFYFMLLQYEENLRWLVKKLSVLRGLTRQWSKWWNIMNSNGSWRSWYEKIIHPPLSLWLTPISKKSSKEHF